MSSTRRGFAIGPPDLQDAIYLLLADKKCPIKVMGAVEIRNQNVQVTMAGPTGDSLYVKEAKCVSNRTPRPGLALLLLGWRRLAWYTGLRQPTRTI